MAKHNILMAPRPELCTGLHLHLDSIAIHSQTLLASGPSFVGNVLVDPTASIAEGCLIGPDVSIGANCKIEVCAGPSGFTFYVGRRPSCQLGKPRARFFLGFRGMY